MYVCLCEQSDWIRGFSTTLQMQADEERIAGSNSHVKCEQVNTCASGMLDFKQCLEFFAYISMQTWSTWLMFSRLNCKQRSRIVGDVDERSGIKY